MDKSIYKPGDDVCYKSKPGVRGWIVSLGPRTCCVNWNDGSQSTVEQSAIALLSEYLEPAKKEEYRVNQKILFYDSQKFQRGTIKKLGKVTCQVLSESLQKVNCFYSDLRKIDWTRETWDSPIDTGKTVIGDYQRRGTLTVEVDDQDRCHRSIVWEDGNWIKGVMSHELIGCLVDCKEVVFYIRDDKYLDEPKSSLHTSIEVNTTDKSLYLEEIHLHDRVIDEDGRDWVVTAVEIGEQIYVEDPRSGETNTFDPPQVKQKGHAHNYTPFKERPEYKQKKRREKEGVETFLEISEIRTDGGTQQRAKPNYEHIITLEDSLGEVDELEPIEVIQEGDTYWLVDGFHRLSAYKNVERSVIPARVRQGTHRDAVLASVSANIGNRALPRTRYDKQKAIKTLLLDPEWSQWSDREIAKIAGVSHPTVAAVRRSLENLPVRSEKLYRTKHGTLSTMATEKIGGGGKLGREDSWNPDHFGKPDYQSEEDGQLTVFYDDSVEPPDPDDYPSLEEYEEAHTQFEEKLPPQPTKSHETIAQEVTIGLVSNVDLLSHGQLIFVRKQVSGRLKSLDGEKLISQIKRDFLENIGHYGIQELAGMLSIIQEEIKVRQHIGEVENADAAAPIPS